jgi:cytochrome c-type biogenesis protein CcsB
MRNAILWVLALVVASAPGWAQYDAGGYEPGIAGNTHPDTELVSGSETELANPFGDPSLAFEGRATPAEKSAFAAALDVSPLRRLAVLHNGRVKILDTLARETVEAITGRHRYEDLVPTKEATQTEPSLAHAPLSGDAPAEKVKHDPVFTLLDLVIDPAYYVDKPLLHVNYLPLRREFLEMAFPGDEAQQRRWKRLTRITPAMAVQFAPAIEDRHIFEQPYRDGLGYVSRALSLWESSNANMLLIAPESADDTWHHLSEWPTDHPVRVAAAELGAAWRALDADRANAAIATLAAEIPTINSELYPTARADLEHFYNQSDAFGYGYWAYLLSTVALILAFGTGRKWLLVTGNTLFVLALLLHAVGFGLRCVIAERFAIQNQFESMTGISLFAGVLGLALAMARKQPLFSAAAAATGFLILIAATETGIPGRTIEREAAILNTSVLLKYHVTTVLVSYGLITLGFIIALFYLGTHYAHKLVGSSQIAATSSAALEPDAAPKPRTTARTLSDLDTAHMTVLQLAFWTLAVGILLGAWWADHSWGRWWAFDPKETWALITWIVYLIVIHLRFTTGKNKALITAWLSVVGFGIMLWTYMGVNLLLPGLHAYA